MATFTGTAGNDNLTGTSSADDMFGLDGDDTLDSGNGNDTLDGGAGTDSMIGGQGDDLYYVDSFFDEIIENDSEGTDTVIATSDYMMADNVENLVIGTDTGLIIMGNALDNIITCSAGFDIVFGGDGNDTYIVQNTYTLLGESIGEGVDTVESSVDFALSSFIENLTLTGTDDLIGAGNGSDNTILGNSGDNMILSLGGSDTVTGALGDDFLMGGLGNDHYQFAQGDGVDTIMDNNMIGSNADSVVFDGSVAQSVVAMFISSGNLQIGYTNSAGDQITVQSQTTTATAIERFELSNGNFMTAADVSQVISDMATYASANAVSFTSLDDVKNDAGLMAIMNAAWHS